MARWLGYYDRVELHPFARRIDDQRFRARDCAVAPMAENGAESLAAMVLAG